MLNARVGRGFTLIELMVTISLFAILVMLAAPSFSTWLKNAQIRTAAEALQGGLRTAQAEALRRNRQVVLAFTNATPASGTTAVVNGKNWTLQTVAQNSSENSQYIGGGSVAETGSAVTITGGVNAVCFNSAGRVAANSSPGVTSATCAAATTTFDLTQGSGSGYRPLRVVLQLGGQIRMCDPARTLSSTAPDGCP